MGGITKGKRFSIKKHSLEDCYFKPTNDGYLDPLDEKTYIELKKLATFWLKKFSLDLEYANDVILYVLERCHYYDKSKLNGGNSFSFYNVVVRNYCIYLSKTLNNNYVDLNDIDKEYQYLDDKDVENINVQFYNELLSFFISDKNYIVDAVIKNKNIDRKIIEAMFDYIIYLLESRVDVVNNKMFIYKVYEQNFDKKLIKKMLNIMKQRFLFFKKKIFSY